MEWEKAWPVLEATYRLMRSDPDVSGEEVAEELGDRMTESDVRRAFRLLHDTGYLDAHFGGGTTLPTLFNATEPGLQETSGWPKPDSAGAAQVEQLLRALDEKIDSPDTPEEEKGKLARIRDSVGDVSRDIVVGVLTSYASRATGVE